MAIDAANFFLSVSGIFAFAGISASVAVQAIRARRNKIIEYRVW